VVTAAYEEIEAERDRVLDAAREAAIAAKTAAADEGLQNDILQRDLQIADQRQTITELTEKVTQSEEMLARALGQLKTVEQLARGYGDHKYGNKMLQLFYDALLAQGVLPEIAEGVLMGAEQLDEQGGSDINLIVRIVYNTIIGILGEPRAIEPRKGAQEIIVFMGPTGVGKTTTIAKLSSIMCLKHKVNVGLVTADTYRIAAVEQLKTYAEILGLELKVVYNAEDISARVAEFEGGADMIMVDTAGRSHNNAENLKELAAMLTRIPESRRILVLSVTSKQDDLLNIIETYGKATEFDIIFTKLDETGTLGEIINICYLTGKHVSYLTFGQNVPDDIDILRPEEMAKALMGVGYKGTKTVLEG
jgi:flagellar biosynthesis protein FlhF